jgi:superfamily II DNA or RNA helicase
LDPEYAYIGTSLYLPKKHIEEGPVRGALTFGFDENVEPRVLVTDHPDHLEVPREFLTLLQLAELELTVVDLRKRITYPRIALSPKPGFSFRKRQVPAWPPLKKARNGTFVMACGGGKTIMAWRKAAELRVPTLIVSPQKAHLASWEKELRDHFILDDPIGWISGKKMEWERSVVLSTVQGLAAKVRDGGIPAGFAQHFGLTIFDEAHHMAAKNFCRAADLSYGDRLALTATARRNDRLEGIYYSHLGGIFYEDLEQEMDPKFYVVDTGIPFDAADEEEIKDVAGQRNVSKLRTWLGQNLARNHVIREVIDFCVKQKRKIYCLTHSVDQAELLSSMYPQSGCITGKVTNHEKRLEILNGHDIVFATMGVGAEAYNRKDLDVLLLLTPFAAKDYTAPAFQQSVGRVQRVCQGKSDAWVFLFMDQAIDESKGMTLSLLREAKRQQYEVNGWNQLRHRPIPKGW